MKYNRGFGLIEILIGITVSAIAGGIIVSLMVSSNNVYFNESTQISQGLSLNQAVNEITELVKSSAGISAQYPATGTAQFVTGSDTLVLKIPAISANGQVIDSVFDYAVLAADPTSPKILRKKIFITSPSVRNVENVVLSTSLKNLSFSYLDASNNPISPIQAARISFTINQSGNSGAETSESSASGVVNFKNL